MDNNTAIACKNCFVIIMYDKDAPVPTVCPFCEANPQTGEFDEDDEDCE